MSSSQPEPSRKLAGSSRDDPAQSMIDAGFAWEIADAEMLHHGLNMADLAHALDLIARGLIPDDAARKLVGILLEAAQTPVEAFPYDARFGESYNSRERHFAAQIGDAAGWLHAGRPRREAARVALRIEMRERVARLIASAGAFVDTAAEVALVHRDAFMADQTYLQQAQPSTFGHYLLGFVPPAMRDAERLIAALHMVNQSPGGAGCVNGTQLLNDRGVVAELLGFDGIIEHTRDAMWQTDTFIDVLSSTVSLVSNQSKLAEDLEIWSSPEFDYVDLAGPYTRASVLMPQKRNPYSLSIVRGGGGVLIGRLTGFLAVVKSPSARSDNLIFAYGEISRSLDFATKISNLMQGVVGTLTVNRDRMFERLTEGFCQATDLAEYVMLACGFDYRTAYLIVGETVRMASRRGLRGVDIDARLIAVAAEKIGAPKPVLDDAALHKALDPKAIVAMRRAMGGAAPAVVEDMAERYQAKARQISQTAADQLRAFKAAEDQLVQRARAFCGTAG